MNRLVKSFKIFAAMPDHRSGQGSQGFRRDLDRTGREKLIVRSHKRMLAAKFAGANLLWGAHAPSRALLGALAEKPFRWMKKKDDLREGAQISTRGACAPPIGRAPFDFALGELRVSPSLFFDEADVAASFYVTCADILEVLRFRGQTQVFLDVMPGDVIASHAAEDQIAILND